MHCALIPVPFHTLSTKTKQKIAGGTKEILAGFNNVPENLIVK